MNPAFSPTRSFTVKELAQKIGAKLIGDETVSIESILPIELAQSNNLCFLAAGRSASELLKSKAGAIIVSSKLDLEGIEMDCSFLQVEDPYVGFAQCTQLFYGVEGLPFAGISESSSISDEAKLGENCQVGPGAFIGPQTTLGDRVVIHPNVSIAENVSIGDDVVIFPNVSIYAGSIIGERCRIHAGCVIGGDGFGYAPSPTGIVKIVHIGRAVIEKDVELGANTTVDRGVLGDTRIGQSTKIDNLTMVAHNCDIGAYTFVAGQAGFAGSAKVGNQVMIGGKTAVKGHITVGDGAQIGGMSAVSSNVPAGARYMGYPAGESSQTARSMIAVKKLPEMRKQLQQLQKQVDELMEKSQ